MLRRLTGLLVFGHPRFSAMRIHHNFIRGHQGLEEDTSADRAGIRVRGNNKWKTIIQNASLNQISR